MVVGVGVVQAEQDHHLGVEAFASLPGEVLAGGEPHPVDAGVQVFRSEVADPAVVIGVAGRDRLPALDGLVLQGDGDALRRAAGDGIEDAGW